MRSGGQRPGLAGLFCIARALLGAAFLRRALASRPSGRGSGLSRGVLAVLGLRHLGQAVASVRPTPAVLALGAETDGLHAATMAAAALAHRPWRWAALRDGLLAAAMAVAGLATARCAGGSAPGSGTGSRQASKSWLGRRDRWAAQAARYLVPGWRRS